MLRNVLRILSAWPMALKRSLANWRLLSSVVVGVVLASAIMAGTVIFFDSLRDIALDAALADREPLDLDIFTKVTRGPTNPKAYSTVRGYVEGIYSDGAGWFIEDSLHGGRSATFFLTFPGEEVEAGNDNARSYFVFLPGIEDKITILPGGRMPNPLLDPDVRGRSGNTVPTAPGDAPLEAALQGDPISMEAIVSENAALEFGVEVGDTLSAVPYWQDATPYMSVTITGLYNRTDPDDLIWELNDRTFHSFTSGNFATVPFLVSEDTFMRGVGKAFPDMDSTYGWLILVDPEKLSSINATDALHSVVGISRSLSSVFTSFRQITDLDDALRVYDQRLLFTKLQMFVVLILIAMVVLYYVITLSSLVAEQRRSEIHLLQGRGATERQILTVFILEGATIAILSIVIAPFLAGLAISLLGYTPAFSDLSGGERLSVNLTRGAFIMSALGGILSFGALMIPAFASSRSSISRDRQEASRPSPLSFFQRYYLDVMLLILGIVLFRQLTEQGSLAARSLLGEVAVNQLLLAVPGIMLIAAAMVLLRLFPIVMSLASRLLAPRLPPGIVLGLWQMARNPTHYSRLALLLILMSGLGIFAASFGGTLKRSFTERTLYSAGADIRLTNVSLNNSGLTKPLIEPYEKMSRVEGAAPVLRGRGSVLSAKFGDASYYMLAVDPDRLADVAWYREDFSDDPLPEVMSKLKGNEIPVGIPLPERARAIQLLVKADRPHSTVGMGVRIRDANGRHFTYGLGFLKSSAWRLYNAELAQERNPRFELIPARPLTLVSIILGETDLEKSLAPGSILIDAVRVRMSNGEVQTLDKFRDIAGWHALRETGTAAKDRTRWSEVSARGDGSLMFAWQGGNALISRGIFTGDNPEPVPVVASGSFVREFGFSEGDEFLVTVNGRRLYVVLADTVDFFPTLNSYEDKFLIADLESVITYVNLGLARSEISPNELWIRTGLTGEERTDLVEFFESDKPFAVSAVIDTEANLEAAQLDPLVLAGWRALLLIAFGAILILSSLGFLVHAYISFRNRELQFALMRTMGFSTRQLVSLMWVEQALVIAVGLALGTWMGGRLGASIMPFLGYDDRGAQVIPPFVIQVGWQNLLVTYVAMAVIFTTIILGVIWFIRRMSLSRVLRLGDG